MARADLHLDIRGHFPIVLSLEKHDHAERHELLVLLPVRHRNFSADWQLTLMLGRLQPSIEITTTGSCLGECERRQCKERQNCSDANQHLHTIRAPCWFEQTRIHASTPCSNG